MREIPSSLISQVVADCCIQANNKLNKDLTDAMTQASKQEVSDTGAEILAQMLKNIEIAEAKNLPVCQDTGMAVVFLEIGQDVHITGEFLETAVNRGVASGYEKGYLRKSVVKDPFDRVNTKNNTPAVIHTEIVPGDQIKITVLPKGFGSENTSAIKMLKPSEGIQGAEDFIVDTIQKAAPNGCAPLVVGVGVGGTFEKAALNAKKALTIPIGRRHDDPCYAALESRIYERANNLGIGPMGLGGVTTVLAVHVLPYPTHIAGLPVAVNICCYVDRMASKVI